MPGREDINLLDKSVRNWRIRRNSEWVRNLSSEYMYCAANDMSRIEYYKRIYIDRIQRLWLVMSGHIRATGLKSQLDDEKQKTAKLQKDLRDNERATSVLEAAVEHYRKAEETKQVNGNLLTFDIGVLK